MENPKWEKPREPTNSKYHYEEKGYNERLRGNDLELYFFAKGRLQQCVSLYLSLCATDIYIQQYNNILSDCPKSYLCSFYLHEFRFGYQ